LCLSTHIWDCLSLEEEEEERRKWMAVRDTIMGGREKNLSSVSKAVLTRHSGRGKAFGWYY
jgi:hypothetical protein